MKAIEGGGINSESKRLVGVTDPSRVISRTKQSFMSAVFVSFQPSTSNPVRCTGTKGTQLVSSTSTLMAVGHWDPSKCIATSQVRIRNPIHT